MPRTHIPRLLAALAQNIGRESAKQELKWMRQTGRTDLEAMLQRRARGEPLQYILGTQPFGPLDLLTRAPVLIPRPETEDWTMRLAEMLTPTPERPLSVLDLCTGSGCVPLLLCHLWPQGSIRAYGVDISDHAVKLAIENATRCGIPLSDVHPQTRSNAYTPYQANILDPAFRDSLPRSFDIITSNPPYIPLGEYRQLPRSVKNFEDAGALLGDLPHTSTTDGLTFYRGIAQLVAQRGVLNDGDQAMVVLEVGDKQARAVESILQSIAGLRRTNIWLDPWGKERVVVGRRG